MVPLLLVAFLSLLVAELDNEMSLDQAFASSPEGVEIIHRGKVWLARPNSGGLAPQDMPT